MVLAAVAAIALSCSKEETAANTGKDPQQNSSEAYIGHGEALMSFGATTPDIISNRLTVNLSTGATAFQENDEALVFVDGSNYAIYKYNGEKFEIKEGEQPVALSSAASVFYPANEFFVSNNRAIFEMPFPVETSAGLGAINPMAGMISGDPGNFSVTFRNFVSVLRVKVTADENIEEVAIDFGGLRYGTSNAYDKAWFDVDASNCEMVYAGGGEYTTSIYLDTPAKSADVLFLIPTLELEDGLKVTAELEANHNGGSKTFTVTNASTAARARNTVSTMSFFAGLFSGGAGTDADPYKISTVRDLKYLKKYSTEGYGSNTAASFLTAYYQQTADISAGSVTPIGTSDAPFTGVYDGNSKTLNVTISTSTDNTGVFGYLQDATVKDLTVAGTVTSSGQFTAGIAGQMDGSSIISGCTNQAAITNTNSSNAYGAGIVGRALETSEIVSCVNEGAISASKAFAAGIVGDMTGTIDMCVNKNTVTGGANTGGIAGALRASSTIRRCYSSKNKTITGTNRVGGIVGYNVAGTVANCFSNSNVTVTSNTANYGAGGLVGILGGLLFNSATGDITVKCSASCTNKDNALVNVGGLVGRQTGGTIQNVYTPVYAKDIKIGSIHGRSSSGKIGQIVGVVAAGNLCAYYFGGCATATTGWQYWGTNSGSDNYEGQWAFTSANNVSMDWTAAVAKAFSGFGQSLTSGNYHLKDVLNIDKSSGSLYSAYTPVDGEDITWSDLSATDFHPIPDALMALGTAYYSE